MYVFVCTRVCVRGCVRGCMRAHVCVLHHIIHYTLIV